MAKCKYPNEACANMKFFHGNTYCDSVPCVLKEESPKPSKADKIRAMSDEELAKFFVAELPSCKDCSEPETELGFCSKKCDSLYLRWLQSEVKPE